MTLTDKAYLVLDEPNGDNQGIFELQIGLQHQSELEKSFIMGSRGPYIQAIVNQTPFGKDLASSADRRAGYWIDGGAGSWSETIDFETGLEDVRWGDGNSATGPSNVTKRDASGAEVSAISRMNVFEFWMARARTDSLNPAFLYFGEWTESAHSLSITTPDGAFGEAMPVAVTNHSITNDPDQPGSLTGSVTVQRILPFEAGIPSWLGDGTVQGMIGSITDALGGFDDE